MKFPHMDEIEVVWAGNACEWRAESVRQAYDLVARSWTEAGVEPQYVAAHAPGVGKKYGSFRHKRRFIESAGFEKVESIEFGRLPAELPQGCTRWEISAWVSPRLSAVVCGCIPSLVGTAANMVRCLALDLLRLSKSRYAYMLRQRMVHSPVTYAVGLDAHVDDDWRPDELRYNVQRWTPRMECPESDSSGSFLQSVYPEWHPRMETLAPFLAAGILRNVYPENYLSEPHLSARLGRTTTTLRDWIEANPAARGVLEPFSDILTKWTPPVERIPELREELYRAGRVFYWRFMVPGTRNAQGGMTPEPYFRPDLSAPWVAPEPIPEIYRADYWKDKDPGLTY